MPYAESEDDVTIDDYPHAHRQLWKIVGTALGLFSIFYGSGYAIEGSKYVISPSYNIVQRIPGGMQTHGFLMIIVGIVMVLDCLHPDATKTHPGVRLFFGYCIVFSVTMFGSWWITGHVQFSSPWAWIAFAGICTGLVKYPPPIDLRRMKGSNGA